MSEKRTPSRVKNPRWGDPEKTYILLDVDFNELDDEWIEFGASDLDPEPHGSVLYRAAMNGDFGPIADWPTPPDTTGEDAMYQLRMKRNELLAMTDKYETPSYMSRLTEEQKTAWMNYRNALRDLPENATNVYKTWSVEQNEFVWCNVVWPTKPD